MMSKFKNNSREILDGKQQQESVDPIRLNPLTGHPANRALDCREEE